LIYKDMHNTSKNIDLKKREKEFDTTRKKHSNKK
jgi:hypothetical protein